MESFLLSLDWGLCHWPLWLPAWPRGGLPSLCPRATSHCHRAFGILIKNFCSGKSSKKLDCLTCLKWSSFLGMLHRNLVLWTGQRVSQPDRNLRTAHTLPLNSLPNLYQIQLLSEFDQKYFLYSKKKYKKIIWKIIFVLFCCTFRILYFKF